ncbi:MAG: Gfo/Idh/MocA family protein [Planctomycetota bacterium]
MPILAYPTIAMLGLAVSAFNQEARPVRVGVLGIDNYQSVAYTQLFNDPRQNKGELSGLKVTVAYPGEASADIQESVDNLPKWKEQIQKFGVRIVASVGEMLKESDVVMIMSLDGRKHRKEAEAVLRAGKPLFIGRPLAADWQDAMAILKMAEETKTPCWSSSQHRFSPGFIGMRNHPEVGKVLGLDLHGGYPTHPSHSEMYWHALHSVDTIYTILGPGCETVACASTPLTESITAVWSDGRVATYRGIKTGDAQKAAVKYSGTVYGDKGVSITGIYGHGVPEKGIAPTKDEYMGYKGIAIEMAKFFKGGPAPVGIGEMREVFAFMEAAQASKRQGGKPVSIADILKGTDRK